MNIRKLEINDYHKGYLQLLEQLTTVGNIPFDHFKEKFNKLNSHIYVIELDNKIIASATIFLEYKFIHNNKNVGHIEDVVTDNNFRKGGLGRLLINKLLQVAKDNECYKVILNCDKDVAGYYKKLNFRYSAECYSIYFDSSL